MASDRPVVAGPGPVEAPPGRSAGSTAPTRVRSQARPATADGRAAAGRVAAAVPAVLVCGLTASAALVPLAVVGSFRPWFGLPLVAVVAGVLLWLWRPDRPVAPDADAPRWFLPAALLVAALAAAPGLVFTNAHAVVDRDPGIYVTTATHVRSQGDLVVAPPAGPFGAVPGVIERTPAQPPLGDGVRGFQGLHLLPVQAGALGWLGGDALMLRVAPLLAGCGLLLLMALARRVVGAPLALVVGVALGASLPFAHASRDLYSEWPLFALVMGGLWALDGALADRSPTRAVVAGAALGAATMARIDGLVTVGGLVLVVGLWAVVARGRADGEGGRRARVAVAAAVPAALGWLAGLADGRLRSEAYLDAHLAETLGQAALPAAGLAVVGAVAVLGPDRIRATADRVAGRRRSATPAVRRRDADVPGVAAARDTPPLRPPQIGGDEPPPVAASDPVAGRADGTGDPEVGPGQPRTGAAAADEGTTAGELGPVREPWVAPRAWAVAGGAAVVVLAFLAVVVRPAFPSGAELPPSAITAGLQAAEGEPIDPGRTYAELSGRWLVWYLGAVAVAAAAVGGALLVARWLRGRRVRVEALLAAVVVPPLVLYLARPSIYPDHPWASRRFLPAVLPGVLVAAAWCARWLWDRRGRNDRWAPAGAVAAVVVAGAMVVHPLVVLAPLVRMQHHTDELAMVRDLCDQVPADAALLTVAIPAEGWVPALTSTCDRPVGGVVDPAGPDPATVADLAAAWAAEGRALWLVAPAGSVLTPLRATPQVSVSAEDDLVLRSRLTGRPGATRQGRTVLVAGPVTTPPP
ncbi:hypothetical protein PO878_09295 [Iamia majanohamensis]|uniref:Uncharacterized protein n=1 Tax=Iamia majanohamensis TaxID=467976 RepID=A0AAF0BVI9_9ACTN|nr:hypothetical protein [Iamia majanohamensis]WCO68917.1 hypothetical protein PO878_09295 [Iamia majanohamensis]